MPDEDRPEAGRNGVSASLEPVREELTAEMYDQLRRLARRFVSRQQPGQTLQATDLLHETYLRLGARNSAAWVDQAHFFRSAAQAMRHILIDRARKRQAVRHGGGRIRLDLRDDHACSVGPSDELLALDEALEKLQKVDERMYQIVMLRYFAGLTLLEAAELVGISLATAKRDWAFAKAWLFEEIANV